MKALRKLSNRMVAAIDYSVAVKYANVITYSVTSRYIKYSLDS